MKKTLKQALKKQFHRTNFSVKTISKKDGDYAIIRWGGEVPLNIVQEFVEPFIIGHNSYFKGIYEVDNIREDLVQYKGIILQYYN